MNYMSIAEASNKWNISKRRIQVLCSQNRIEGVTHFANAWAIPSDASKPCDARIKTGKYREKEVIVSEMGNSKG